jgi:hypothetical protein
MFIEALHMRSNLLDESPPQEFCTRASPANTLIVILSVGIIG